MKKQQSDDDVFDDSDDAERNLASKAMDNLSESFYTTGLRECLLETLDNPRPAMQKPFNLGYQQAFQLSCKLQVMKAKVEVKSQRASNTTEENAHLNSLAEEISGTIDAFEKLIENEDELKRIDERVASCEEFSEEWTKLLESRISLGDLEAKVQKLTPA